MLLAVGVTAFLHEWVDSSVIFVVVIINAIVGFLQEAKAEKAIEALAKMVATETTVRRDDRKLRLHSEQLVPGDVVLLQSGDRVPADMRLVHVRNLHADESALTGESLPVAKHPDPLAMDTILAERKNLAYTGTLITSGQAEGIVWAIGDQTETGRISHLISSAVELSTPLTKKIAQFSKLSIGRFGSRGGRAISPGSFGSNTSIRPRRMHVVLLTHRSCTGTNASIRDNAPCTRLLTSANRRSPSSRAGCPTDVP